MLLCAVMVATAIPSVSATATTLTTVSDEDIYVMLEGNQTSDDVSELIGLSLDETDTLYVSYYNRTTELVVDTSFVPTQDADEVVWFDIELPEISAIQHQIWFSDEAITDYADVSSALYINETVDDTTNVYIVTIPDGVMFTYDENGYEYGDECFEVTDSDGDEAGNITSYNYSTDFAVYGMNLTEDSSHQLVIVTDELETTAVAAAGKRVTDHKWYWFDTAVPYSMSTESTTDYNIFGSSDGYVAFNVYKDTGYLSKYIGGKTPFRMTENTLQYGTHKWYWPFSTTWTTVSTHEAAISGIKLGVVERIWMSEATGANENNEYLKDNYGVITSKGAATTVSGFDILKMGTSRTPQAVIDTGKALFA